MGAARRREMSLREYAEWWRQHKAGAGGRLLYLKDWHFASEFPGYQVCRPPWPGNVGCIQAAARHYGLEWPEPSRAYVERVL